MPLTKAVIQAEYRTNVGKPHNTCHSTMPMSLAGLAELHALALRGVSRTKLPFEQPDCENSDRWKLGARAYGPWTCQFFAIVAEIVDGGRQAAAPNG